MFRSEIFDAARGVHHRAVMFLTSSIRIAQIFLTNNISNVPLPPHPTHSVWSYINNALKSTTSRDIYELSLAEPSEVEPHFQVVIFGYETGREGWADNFPSCRSCLTKISLLDKVCRQIPVRLVAWSPSSSPAATALCPPMRACASVKLISADRDRQTV